MRRLFFLLYAIVVYSQSDNLSTSKNSTVDIVVIQNNDLASATRHGARASTDIEDTRFNQRICPNDCSGIGICNQDGSCNCPNVDPSTGIYWYVPPNKDCSAYGIKAYGVEMLTFRISWGILYLFGFGFMALINLSLYVENGHVFQKSVKSVCFILINLAFMGRALYYMIDPYSLKMIIHPIPNRILSSSFYPLTLLAYCGLLFEWIEICSPDSKFIQDGYVSSTKIAGGIFALILITMEIIMSYLQSNNNEFVVYWSVYYVFVGLVITITIPLYIYYGNHFRLHLASLPNQDESIQNLRQRIFFLSYAPGFSLLITFIICGLDVWLMRKNQDLFLIGEAVICFMEMITLGIFIFALFTRKDMGISDEQDLFEKSNEAEMSIKTSGVDPNTCSLLSVPENAITIV